MHGFEQSRPDALVALTYVSFAMRANVDDEGTIRDLRPPAS